eukprot:Em0019g157a
MCGIWAAFGDKPCPDAQCWLKKMSGRGPEESVLKQVAGGLLGFARLAINGLNHGGMQPMENGNLHWVCNGEIYNWRDLSARYNLVNRSGSDCEILGSLWEQMGKSGIPYFRSLDGVFAMLIVDTTNNTVVAARDPYGVRPLYVGHKRTKPTSEAGAENENEYLMFSSETKGLLPFCDVIEPFPPGCYAVYDLKQRKRIALEPFHTVPWLKVPFFGPNFLGTPEGVALERTCAAVSHALEAAVRKRMMTERPVAALLSGGVDSSLIAALVQKQLVAAKLPPLKTFSIGFEGSSDLAHAQQVASFIGSDHYEIVMTPDDFWRVVPDVIRDIESYDITTVRASVGNWLVSREIRRRTDCKVVFNGDGSDEVNGSYLYFYNSPSDEAFESEVERLLRDIHFFDVLRSDRSISSHGLEARTPFLDKQFVALMRSLATQWRRPIKGERCEKWILRKAFEGSQLLPDSVLWRRKEAFSDGVSGAAKSWYQECKERAAAAVPEGWAEQAASIDHLRPSTAEAWYYRSIYREHYGCAGEKAAVPYHWMPKWTEGATDPSARTLSIY